MPLPTLEQVRERLATSFSLDHLYKETMGLPDGDTKQPVLEALSKVLDQEHVPYALIGGVAVQIYSEDPRTTNDLDIALVRYEDIPKTALEILGFEHERMFEHSDNWRAPGTSPRKQRTPIQFTVDKLTPGAVERAQTFIIGGVTLKVASMPDLVRLKLEAAEEPRRRGSKRLSDMADVRRLLEEHPEIAADVPDAWSRLEVLLDREHWELYWAKYGPPIDNYEAARRWWLTPGPKPRDVAALMDRAPEVVRQVVADQGLPPTWKT